MKIHRGFHLEASEGLNPAPTYLCGLKWRELYHAFFLRQTLDQQVVQVVNGQGTLQIPGIMKAVEVDPSAVTD